MALWKVHKFGGTSVANAERYRAVCQIVRSQGAGARQAVVVSAMAGVTDALLALVELAKGRKPQLQAAIDALKEKHFQAARELEAGAALVSRLESDFSDLLQLLRGVGLAGSASPQVVELISGYGELWSAQLFESALQSSSREGSASAAWLDARQVLVVRESETAVSVDWELSARKLDAWLREHPEKTIAITGFIASTPEGIATTLKRNGSDYSATIFAALLSAESVTIWKEVDGILSADPRVVRDAIVLDELTYEEASELAYFGAKVLHPSAMAPVIQKKIPIWIRNSMRPELPGTKIHAQAKSIHAVKGFSVIERVALINVEGTGMMGVPGVAQRVFGALREIGVSVILISQASSEHSICLVVPEGDLERARLALERAFYAELQWKQIERIQAIPECAVLAVVGEGMVEQRGVAARFFSNLSRAGVNVRAIAQGSSERNISVVIQRSEVARALRAAHSGFYLSRRQISLGLIGPGQVGRALLEQLESQKKVLAERFNVELNLRGVLSSREMWLSPQSHDWRAGSGKTRDLDSWIRHVCDPALPQAVIIDCSASDEVAERYADWMAQGASIITPNKRAGSGSLARYQKIRSAERTYQKRFLYEATVGAGLPIITTLQDLIHTGDRVRKIEGILSGTLSFLFNSLSVSQTFSSVLAQAIQRGYTEPDPRDDLSGMDVARKITILARELGTVIEVAQVEVESLTPPSLASVSRDEFLARTQELDPLFQARLERAAQSGQVLRYVASFEAQESGRGFRCTVGVREFPAAHAFARVRGTDNIVAITSDRYCEQPLVVQGPGAGLSVTAGGIFADLLRWVGSLG